MATLNKNDLSAFRDRLESLRSRLRGDVKGIADGAFGREDGESRSPTHLAELGSENYEQDFALDLIRNEQETLEEISKALSKIDDGRYGLCEGCLSDGKPEKKSTIPKGRLKEIPWARNCVDCQRKAEAHIY